MYVQHVSVLHLLLLPSNIPLYGQYHIWFIHLLVARALGYLPFLALMNSAVINVHIQIFVYTQNFNTHGYIYLGIDMLDDMVTLCLTF